MAILATGWIHSNVYSVNLRSITTHAVWLLHKYIAHIKGGINMFPRWTRIADLYWQRIVKNDVTDNKEGGRTCVTYFAEEGYFFKTSACPRFCKRRLLLCTQERNMGGENPLTIYEIWAALTPSDYRNDWVSEPAAAKQAEDYII